MKGTYSTFKTLLFLYDSVDFVVSYADWIILLLFFSSLLTGKYLIFICLFYFWAVQKILPQRMAYEYKYRRNAWFL